MPVDGLRVPLAVPPAAAATTPQTVDPVLLTCARIATFDGSRLLTGATGFFYCTEGRLYLVTSRHVLVDEPTGHFPDRIEIELHTDAINLTRAVWHSLALYGAGRSLWRQAKDSGGEIDVAVLALDAAALPGELVMQAFTPAHLMRSGPVVEVGSSLVVVGFPLGFHDTVHHLPVVRHAAIASSFGIRFQGQGCFLTDARTHRGTSGAPVLRRRNGAASPGDPLPWDLLGVHSSRLDMANREQQDESLGLNCAWYADILNTLTRVDATPGPATPQTKA